MSFESVLAKIASVMNKVVGVAAIAAPAEAIVNEMLPSTASAKAQQVEGATNSELVSIAGAIGSAQAAVQAVPGKLTTTDAVTIAAGSISQVIQTSPLMSGKTIADAEKYTAGISALGEAFAAILDSLKSK